VEQMLAARGVDPAVLYTELLTISNFKDLKKIWWKKIKKYTTFSSKTPTKPLVYVIFFEVSNPELQVIFSRLLLRILTVISFKIMKEESNPTYSKHPSSLLILSLFLLLLVEYLPLKQSQFLKFLHLFCLLKDLSVASPLIAAILLSFSLPYRLSDFCCKADYGWNKTAQKKLKAEKNSSLLTDFKSPNLQKDVFFALFNVYIYIFVISCRSYIACLPFLFPLYQFPLVLIQETFKFFLMF
jgi:hypothetical protein